MKNPLNQVDLAFIVDTTGSMGPFIDLARRQMIATLQALTDDASLPVELQAGLVQYRDHPPQDRSFVYRVHKFDSRLKRFQKTINKLKPDGGGDAPEAVYDGLKAACDKLAWRPHSRRIGVLVGDAPPHGYHSDSGDGFPDGCPCGMTADSTTALFEENGITLYALGLTRGVRPSFSHLACFTGGDYFDATQRDKVIEVLKTVLVAEFKNLAFDQRVLEVCKANAQWSSDAVAAELESGRGKVAASLSRLGRRGLIKQRQPI